MQVESTGTNTPPSIPLAKPSLSLLVSGATAYSVAVGMFYLWGYWSPFGIKILDYMGMADILTATAWPLFGVFSGMLIGMLMGGRNDLHQNHSANNRVGKALRWYWTNLRELHFFGLFLVWILDVPNKWFLLALFGGTPLTVYLLQQSWVDKLPLPQNFKLIIIFFVLCAPAGAITTGQQHSKNLLDGRVFQVVYSDVTGIPIPSDAKPDARLRLIGQRGDTLFLWDPQLKRTIISKFPTDRPLVLGRIDMVSTGTGWDAISLWVKTQLQ